MGHFIYFDPNKSNMETAEELQPKPKPKRVNLISPEDWTYCEKEQELTRFAERNKG
ncbi:hypothetical protein [Desulforamulus putei]|uniref:Uncharacterized protein n=1 Tax=Desulforamulus putei DSM 12395 TaxID=1121429 RepID=A0A1M4T1H9_9FIRM|nr:hypothetical protein [Desulforamulus putei]SHE38264.1 hypothetical protein SAMN02745133_00316 [Desulforamulus putei DSM 12395]